MLIRAIFALIVTNGVLQVNAFALASDALCERIARLEDKEMLGSLKIALSHDEAKRLDLNHDGVSELVTLTGMHNDVSINGSTNQMAPNLCSVTARNDGVINIDGAYYGVIRSSGMLYMVWRFEKTPGENFRGVPMCRYDRKWEETGCGVEQYPEKFYTRTSLSRPAHSPNRKTAYSKYPFLDEVYARNYSVAPYSDKIEVDFDNDGKKETVGTVLVRYPSPDAHVYEMPVTFNDNGEIEPTFQNARIIQFLGEEKRVNGYSDDLARIAFLESENGRVFIEDRYLPSKLLDDDRAPQRPFRHIYKLTGASPRVMCKSEFSWTTVYKHVER